MTPPDMILREALHRAVADSESPGATAAVGNGQGDGFVGATGRRRLFPTPLDAEPDTVFDLASLTKVVATTTAIMLLVEDGLIDLDQPYSEIVPVSAFSAITFRHLLTHSAGLAPGFAYYRQHTSVTEMIDHYAYTAIQRPPGQGRVYSDVGFMMLGYAVELASKDTLDHFCRRRIFKPLNMTRTDFTPPELWEDDCAATEDCGWRDYVVQGVVHDENAFAVGGVSGHAGLFSTAGDLAVFCQALMAGKILRLETLDEMTRLGHVPSYPWQGLGWLIDPFSDDAQGFLPSRAAIGHTGWTGTTIWMDRQTQLHAILLGNTCHPSRTQRSNRTFRRVFYTAIADSAYADHRAVHTGLDRVMRDGFDAIENRTIGVLTNSAAVDLIGRSILDVLPLSSSTRISAYYSPEHGLRGTAEAGEKVGSQAGAVPIISLYGSQKAPSVQELKNLDYLVIDLPDIGARYYTYIATMKACLEACGQAGCKVMILDRPNPLGGDIVEGPIAENTNSLVCCAPIPVRHGMTMGELAQHFAASMRPSPRIEVIPLDSWKRSFFFNDCSLPWVAPSPNMPSAEAALAYVGTCLFEGTNLNEGRGTETPFTVFGAPWLDPDAVLKRLPMRLVPGCRLNPTEYTPISIPGKATTPRYQDTLCHGIRITEMEPRTFRPFTLAIALLCAIREQHGNLLEITDFFDTLAGNTTLRNQITSGQNVLSIVDNHMAAAERFRAGRKLLYS